MATKSAPSMLASALAYAEAGYKIFPVAPRGKAPLTRHGYHDATDDADQIRAWWAETPDANLGLPCEPNRILVLDVDRGRGRPDGRATLRALAGGAMPEVRTPTAVTGGGGIHYLFALPDWRPTGSAGESLDIKAAGYIVVAPSEHESGRLYRWRPGYELGTLPLAPVPAWLEAAIRRPERQDPAPAPARPYDADGQTGADTARQALALLDSSHADEYAAWLRVGMALHAAGADCADWDAWSRQSPRWEPDACARKWATFGGDGVGLGTLIDMAREREPEFLRPGWRTKRSGAPSANGRRQPAPTPPEDYEPPLENYAAHSDDYDPGPPPTVAPETEGEKQSTKILRLAGEAGAVPFRAQDGQPWVSVPDGPHRTASPLGEQGAGVRKWLERLYRLDMGSTPSSSALSEAAFALVSDAAAWDAPTHTVHLRVAPYRGGIVLDLGRTDWQVVEVTGDGWRVIPCPVDLYFRRVMGTTGDLPLPARGDWQPLLDLLDGWLAPDDQRLIIGWLVACLQPGKPYSILSIYGEQGSGKSTLARIIRYLIDPSGQDGRGVSGPPRDIDALAAHASHRLICAFDNLSGVTAELADALCRLSTNSEIGKRQLYTDFAEASVRLCRPIIINGIAEITSRADLMERTLPIAPRVPAQRLTEGALWERVEAIRPATLGAILDACAAALRHRGQVEMIDLPRMADAGHWLMAAERGGALPWEEGTIVELLHESAVSTQTIAADSSPLTEPLLEYVRTQGGQWEGTPADLLQRLTTPELRAAEGWPQSPTHMGRVLSRLAGPWRTAGLGTIERRRANGIRNWVIILGGDHDA
mgnify:CR=1 FL=1